MANRLTLADAIVAAANTGRVPDELTALDAVTGTTIANGTQAAHIVDATTAHALNATFSDTEVEAALNALGTKINAILVVLETFKLTATS